MGRRAFKSGRNQVKEVIFAKAKTKGTRGVQEYNWSKDALKSSQSDSSSEKKLSSCNSSCNRSK